MTLFFDAMNNGNTEDLRRGMRFTLLLPSQILGGRHYRPFKSRFLFIKKTGTAIWRCLFFELVVQKCNSMYDTIFLIVCINWLILIRIDQAAVFASILFHHCYFDSFNNITLNAIQKHLSGKIFAINSQKCISESE